MEIELFIRYCIAVSHSKLEEMITELSAILSSVKHEQEYMTVRERIHRASKLSTCAQYLCRNFVNVSDVLMRVNCGSV